LLIANLATAISKDNSVGRAVGLSAGLIVPVLGDTDHLAAHFFDHAGCVPTDLGVLLGTLNPCTRNKTQ